MERKWSRFFPLSFFLRFNFIYCARLPAFLVIFGQKNKAYGGFNVIFSGDFRQLAPVCGDIIFSQRRPLWDNALNTYVELNGMHRFAEDPEWGGNYFADLEKGHRRHQTSKK